MNDCLIKTYYFLLFVFLLPSVNIDPVIYSSHAVGKIILAVLFIYIFLIKKSDFFEKLRKQSIITLFSLFFVSQALSVVNALDIYAYISRFEDYVFIFMLLLLSIYILQKKTETNRSRLTQVFLIITSINIFFRFLIFIYPDLFLSISQKIFHPLYVELIKYNINRGRVYFESYDEVFIPFLFFYLRKKQIITLVGSILLLYFSIISNFRTKLLMFFFSFLSSMFILFKKGSLIIFTIFLILLTTYIAHSYSIKTRGESIVTRLLLEEQMDIRTISFRFDSLVRSFNVGLSSPIFGVGLGSYNYYLPSSMRVGQTFSTSQLTKSNQEAALHPHNILFYTLAESGFFGIITFLLILLYFVKVDLRTLRKTKSNKLTAFIISFWTLFIYAFFNPTINFSYNLLFWLLRTAISVR